MLILQREGLGMYLSLINGGGGKIFAANKQGVISQRCLLGKLTGSPHQDTTQKLCAHKGKTPMRPVCEGGLPAATLSLPFINAVVLVVCFHEPHTIINSTSTCDDKR